MSMSGRPVSLQGLLAIKRAQAARERMEAACRPAPPRQGLLASILGRPKVVANEDEVEPRKRAA